jgi:hypothetical protein
MLKNLDIWLPDYIKQRLTAKKTKPNCGLKHILFCLVDHFEPRWNNADINKEVERVDAWIDKYSRIAKTYKDCQNNPPKYTFFYPIDEYTPEALDKISNFCKSGLAEAEIQLHHDKDTPESLRQKLEYAKQVFVKHGLLCRDKATADTKYGFIHGNWALDNSRKDGRWCGVNNELQVLSATGCYADFTLPSAPSETQTSKINSIYYAADNPAQPKSHNTGVNVEVGKKESGDLMLIQGPLALNWRMRKFGIIPRIENGQITLENPAIPSRIDLWVRQGIGVKGKPEWVFVKVHTHGAQDKNLSDAYFANLESMYSYLEKNYNDGRKFRLYYVTAREMYNIIKAAEADMPGDPGQYKDFLLTLR